MENLNEFTNSESGEGKIHFRINNRILSIDIAKILYCKAEGSYTRVYIEDNCLGILVPKAIKMFKKCLPEKKFLRCHNSYFINTIKVQSFDSRKNIIVLERQNILVSRRKAVGIFIILSDLGIPDVKIDDQL